MYKRLYVIAIVPNEKKHTLYLFERREKFVVPVEVEKRVAKSLLGQDDVKSPVYPGIYNTVWRLINGFGGKVVSVTIYGYENEKFYVYLNVVFQHRHLEFNVEIGDAVNIAKRFECAIYIKTELLEKCGLKVNRKILRDALAGDY